MIKIKFLLNKIDKSCLYAGKIGKRGFYQDTADSNVIYHLLKIYKEYKDTSIHLKYSRDKNIITEIFNFVKPIVKDYLGKNIIRCNISQRN